VCVGVCPTAHGQLPTAHGQLPTAHGLLPTSRARSLSLSLSFPTAHGLLPTAHGLLPTSLVVPTFFPCQSDDTTHVLVGAQREPLETLKDRKASQNLNAPGWGGCFEIQ
jgi:hypothetical protein